MERLHSKEWIRKEKLRFLTYVGADTKKIPDSWPFSEKCSIISGDGGGEGAAVLLKTELKKF